jgi:SAM-dependent methyltransferase
MFPHDPAYTDLAPGLPATLLSLLTDIAATIDHIANLIVQAAPGEVEGIFAGHRHELQRAVGALGAGIIDFLAEGPSPKQIETVRAQIATPIRTWSATSPVFNRMARSAVKGPRDFEVPGLVLQNQRAGADVWSLIMNDFYLHSLAARAFRNRFAMLSQRLLQEVTWRADAGINPVRVINLKCDTGTELVRLADNLEPASIQITCLDEDGAALRAARVNLDKRLPMKTRFLRINALKYARSPLKLPPTYHVSYAAALWDHLTDSQAVALIRDCHDLLAPGGVLILGCPTRGIPTNERVIIAWVLNLMVHYRDEADFYQLFAQTPFGSESPHFEREPLGGDMLVIAQRP